MSLFSSAMSRGEVNNREVIRLPRVANGAAAERCNGRRRRRHDDYGRSGKGSVGGGVEGFWPWRQVATTGTANAVRPYGTTGSPSTYHACQLARALARRLSPRPVPRRRLLYYYYFISPSLRTSSRRRSTTNRRVVLFRHTHTHARRII